MSLAILKSRTIYGIEAPEVNVEVYISGGLPSFSIVGLPETIIKESKDRVRSAILFSNFSFPAKKIVVNLAPAAIPKHGGQLDLPIAIGILIASKQIKPNRDLNKYEIVGEMALSGQLKSITGALQFALACKKENNYLILPKTNLEEANLISNAPIIAATNLIEVCLYLCGEENIKPISIPIKRIDIKNYSDFSEVYQQKQAKRALEIAAAGRHGVLMIGPPGTGKTMLAQRLPTIIPEMTEEEIIESTSIRLLAGEKLDQINWQQRPFRAPHHSISSAAFIGGGAPPKPGEISRAHNGILFLDELPEFKKNVIESLREPLEEGVIKLARGKHYITFPANFQLIAAMNPCNCGYYKNNYGKECLCPENKVIKYQSQISRPILDRIDIYVRLTEIKNTLMYKNINEENSNTIKERVTKAIDIQLSRNNKYNSQITNNEIKKICALGQQEQIIMEKANENLGLSARSINKLLKVARTIADLEKSEKIESHHLTEAICYRKAASLMVTE